MNGANMREVLAVAAAALLSAVAWADQPDLLEQARLRREIAAQALEADVRAALREADKLKADPTKATEVLKGALAKLDKDDNLKSERRVALLLELKERLALIEVRGKLREDPTVDTRPKREESKTDELLRRDLDHLKALRLDGKHAEAGRLANEIAKRYPDHPAATQARERNRAGENVRDAEQIRSQKASSTAAVARNDDRSAAPIPGDIQYPPGWLKLSEERKKRNQNQLVPMSEKEKQIVELLNGVTSTAISFKDTPFEDVIKLLEKEFGLPLNINKSALDEMKVDYTTTLSASLPRQVSRRTLLRRVLSELGLTYIVKNDQIEVTSVLRAQNELTTRFFDIGDMIKMGALAGGGATLQGGVVQDPIQGLIDFIQATVDPGSWQRNGGAGTITYFPPTRTLIVRNTAEVINSLGGGRAK